MVRPIRMLDCRSALATPVYLCAPAVVVSSVTEHYVDTARIVNSPSNSFMAPAAAGSDNDRDQT